jgi:hypothetical protein
VRVDRTGTETFIGLFASKVNKANGTCAASFGKETSNSRFPTFEHLQNGMKKNNVSKMSRNAVQLEK